jgi:hypothetical protein
MVYSTLARALARARWLGWLGWGLWGLVRWGGAPAVCVLQGLEACGVQGALHCIAWTALRCLLAWVSGLEE